MASQSRFEANPGRRRGHPHRCRYRTASAQRETLRASIGTCHSGIDRPEVSHVGCHSKAYGGVINDASLDFGGAVCGLVWGGMGRGLPKG